MQKFLRLFVMLALLFVPCVTMGQNARVNEYDYTVNTGTYSTIVGTSGATAWAAADQTAGYVDIAMPFAMYFGEDQVTSGSTLRVYDNGSAEFMSLTGSQLAPLYYDLGYTTTATSIHYKSSAQQLTVEWRKVTANGNSSYSFQLMLYPGGDIEFCYGPMTLGSSISVFTGLQSGTDIFRATGESSASDWSTLARATTSGTRTLSSNYYPAEGTVYTFTQPACAKPSSITATATAWNTISVEWTVSNQGTGYEVKYSTNPDFDPATEGTSKPINSGSTLSTSITGLTGSTTYYFYVRKNCGGTYSGWSTVASATTLPGCFNANMPTATAGGVITWTSPDPLVTSYDVKYGPSGFNPETEGTAVNNITGLTTTLTGLAQLTTYDVYIRTHCNTSGLTTDWVGPVSFSTPASLPYTCDFETSLKGFNFANGTLTNKWCYGSATNNGGNNSIYISNNGGNSNAYTVSSAAVVYAYVSLPLNTAGEYQVAYDWIANGESTYDYIRVAFVPESVTLTAGTSLPSGLSTTALPSGWIALDGGQKLNLASSWQSENRVVNITEPGNYKLVFVWRNDGSSGTMPPAAIDNISVRKLNCNAPSNIAYSNGTVTWTAGDATQWQVRVAETGQTNYTYAIVNSASYTPTGLIGNTAYTIGVRSICGAGDTVDWINYNFRTPCGITALPYGENFTDYSGFANTSYPYYGPSVLPNCWDLYSNGTNTATTSGSTSYFGSVWRSTGTSYGSMEANNNYLCLPIYIISTSTTNSNYINYNAQRGDTKYAIFPEFSQPLNNLMVSFNYKISTANSATASYSALELGYITNNDVTTFQSMQTYEATSTTTQSVNELSLATLAASAPTGARLAFRYSGHHNGTSTTSNSTVYCGIDNIFVEQIPTCFKPTITHVSYHGVVSWNSVTGTSSYEIVAVPTGYDVATGTVIDAGTGTSYQLTGLADNTTYDVYVRSRCSATDVSVWSFAYTFTTPCAPMALPYSENFEAYGSGAANPIDVCWRKGTNSTTAYPYPNSSNAITGSRSLYFYAYKPASATATAYYSYAALPKFSAAINTLQLSFNMRRYSTTTDYYTSRVVVGVMTDPTDITTFIPVDTIDLKNETGSSVHQIDVSFAGYTGPSGAIAIYDEVPPLYGTSTYSYSYVYIDDINVDVIPTCLVPNNLAVSNVTAIGATLTWNERALSTQWEVKYGSQGFDPDENGISIIVNANPTLNLDYLEASTAYDVYVRAICNPEGPTEWSQGASFTTSGYPCISYGTPGPEETITIGDGTTTDTYLPANSLYDYSISQQIYTPEDIGGAGVINSIGFEFVGVVARSAEIYLVESNKSSFSSTSDWETVTASNLVWTGTIGAAAGWQTMNLTTPFNYSGSSNLIVVVVNTNGSWTSGLSAYVSSGHTNMSLYARRDGTPYDISNLPAGTSVSSNRNNLRLGIQYASCVTGRCMPPQVNFAFSETEYEATVTFTNANEDETNPTYGIIWGPQGFNPRTAGTTVSPITTNTYTLTNLTPLTDYDVYAYAICASGDVDTVRYSFTSQFIPNCKTPVLSETGYGASNITYNTANLTWRQPGDTPLYWTVRYADADFNPATATASEYTEVTVNTGAATQLTGLVAGTTYYVYVKSVCVESPLDESAWSAVYTFNTPVCANPTAVAANDVTNSTAMISWTSNATSWTVKYGLTGFDPDMEGTAVAATVDSIELTGLDAYAYYDVYVMSHCTATDSSDWSSVVTFRTSCPEGGDIVLGDHTSTNQYLPYYAYYNYSLSEQIYTAEEMGAAKELTGFSYEVVSTTPTRDVVIYLGETNVSSFSSVSDAIPLEGLTQVYDGTMDGATGWHSITFDTPFNYSGSGNLVFVVDRPYESWANSGSFGVIATSTPQALYGYSDGTDVTPENLSSVSSGVLSYKNNFIFPAACDTSVTCFAPASVSTEITTSNVVTVTWAPRTDLRPVVNNYELKYGLAGFDPETAGTLVSDLNNINTYIINEQLSYGHEYDVYVRTVCDADNDDYSAWTKGSFTTYPSCWVPDSVTVDAISATQTSITLAWRENTPTPATRWEIAYGEPGFDPDNVSKANYVETTNRFEYAITGLHHSTSYDIYVRAICGTNNYSEWSNKVTAATACGTWTIADLPLTEDFESSANDLPLCWEYGADGTGYSYTNYVYNGNYSLFFNASTDSDIVALPAMDIHDTVCVMTFYTRPESYSYSDCGTFSVGYITNLNNNSTFVPIEIYNYNDWTASAYEYKEVLFDHMPAGAHPAFLHLTNSSNYWWFVDDVTFKLREEVNTLANDGGTIEACSEFIMLDTAANHGTYANNLNATYIVKPATAGKVAHLTGEYDMENGYDFVTIYRGAASEANLLGTYTGTGSVDFVTSSNLWSDSGYFTIVVTSDDDNALNHIGFKFLVSCECPMPAPDVVAEVVETNGTYTWRNGTTYTKNLVNTYSDYDPEELGAIEPDLTQTAVYTYVNVANCDSVNYSLDLTVHPTYRKSYNKTICERDSVVFYGQTYTATGNYTVTLQSQYGADSVGVLALQVNPAPLAMIYYNNQEVETIDAYCDNADLVLEGRSNVTATYKWEDASTDAIRTVNPHESDTYSVIATNPTTGCTSLPVTVTVTTTPVPDLTISGTNEICYGQSTTLTVADANTLDASYVWKKGTTNVGTGTTITVNPTETTTYTVTATTNNASACAITAEYTVTVNPLPVIATPTTSVSELCLNQSVTLNAQVVDGYTYEWSTGATTAEATTVPAATGAYTVTVTDLNGCVNEFTTAAVTVHPSYELNEERSACIGMLPYTWGAQTLAAAGNYDQTFTIAHGCDSLVHLTFVVEDTAVNNAVRVLCEGASFTFGEGIYEQTYTATTSTVLTYVDTTSGECPARFNLDLTVNTHNPATVEHTVCDTYTWPLNNETYTVSGAYQTLLQTTKGCDSLVTLNLTVNYQNTGVEEVPTVCDSYTWALNGETYTEPTNEPTFTLQNQWGCDSVVTLNLAEVKHSTTGVDNIIYCASTEYTWINGRTYRLSETSGNVSYTLPTPNAQGCDTTSILNLTMNYVLDSLNWKDSTVCDELVIDTVACDNTVATAYIRETGDYKLRIHNATTGNDQILRLHLTVVPSSYHTTMAEACLPYTWTILDANDLPFEVATITEEMVNGANPFNMSVDLAEAGYASTACAQIEVLRLTPKYPTVVVDTVVTICGNETWTAANNVPFNGSDYAAGTYTLTWKNDSLNAAGCKLTQQVELTVNPVYTETMELTFCESDFTFNTVDSNYVYTLNDENHDGQSIKLTYDNALNETPLVNQTATANWTTVNGCDSVVNITFTVNPTTTLIDTVQALTEYVWDVNNVRYEGIGQHIDTVKADNGYGCTLYKVLNLTITDSIRHYDTIKVCTKYEVDGVTYVEDMTFIEVDTNDEVWYTTYHVMQRTFNEVYVVSNMPYTWMDGVTYTADTNNVYYGVPAVNPGECDDIYKLTFTMVPEIVICEGQVPYNTGYGFTIDTTVSDVWNNNDANGNDTIIAYTVNLNVDTALTEMACDSYTWNDSILGDTTFVESGVYTRTYDAANGCDSIVTLTLTINASTTSTMADTACDSYAWNTKTYDSTGVYTYTTTNAKGCDSTATLNLVINVNNGVEETVTACDSYIWNGIAFDTDTNVTKSFNDANGCAGDSVLHLTINNTVTGTADSIVNAASTIYMGVLYNAPLDTVINDTLIAGAANGCDSITMMRLQVNMGTIVMVDTVSCGDFTWLDGNTYTWIPMSERLNPAFNYKNLATNQPVEDFPVFEVDNNGDGLIDITYVLHLVMAEASTEYKTVTVLLSNDTYTDPADTNHVFDFSAEKAAKQNATKLDTLHYGSTYYCDSIVYYTFNLVYNYVDDDTVTVCYSDSVYTTQNGAEIALTVGENAFTDTIAANTDSAMVHNKVYVRSAAITGAQTLVACDSVTWNNTLFTANVVDSLVTLTAANGCDSVVTLNVTITPTIHNVVDTNVCDNFYWADKDSTYELSTTDTWSRANATDAQCTDVDTLKLVVRHMTTSIDSLVACDSLVWIDGITYYASNSTATDTLTNAAGCDSVVTLNLTINNSVAGPGNDIDTLGASITLTDKNGTYLFLAPYDGDTTLTLQTVAGCDSVVTFHLTVSQFQIIAENPIECGMYIWPRNNHMYQWISDEVKAANAINIPGASPMLPLYKDVTADVFVYNNPLDTVNDIVYLLNLNLNEAQFVDSTIARFPQSVGTLTLHGTDFLFDGVTSATKPAVDTTVYLTLPNATLCGTVMQYNVHVVYDSITDAETVCFTDTYTWEDSTTSAVTVGSGNVITKTLFANNWDSLRVVTRTITVRANNNTYSFDIEACDTYTWNDSVYTTTGAYTQTFTDQYGCDSIATLNLTMKYNTNSAETLTVCDSTDWNGIKLYASGDTTHSYTAGNGCASVDTLHLTVNHNEPQVTVVDTCDTYTWDLNNRTYTESVVRTATRFDAVNNCPAVDTLKLTIRTSTSYDSVLYVTDGSYRYTAQDSSTTLIMAGQVATFAEHYTNAAGCDSTLNIEIHVGEGAFAVDDTTVCDNYTWRDGNTYVWISAEERAANGNALYKNQTTGAYVMSNPIYSVPNSGSFDSIYMLRLNLTQNYTYDTTINFPISLGVLNYGGQSFDYTVSNDEGRVFADTTVEEEVHFNSAYYCDSIHYLHINLQNNYTEVADTDICVTQTSFTWRGHEISTATNDYDHAHTYYVYDTVGTTEAPVVEYIKVTQHPVVYATERRTACDSYTWVVGNDTVGIYTESTSNATYTTTNQYGCDSTVTLMLTIKKSTDSTLTVAACETYTWSGITFTESADTTLVGLTNAVGCDSTATLHLTVNHKTSTAYTEDACDSYTWTDGDGLTYTTDTTVYHSYNTGVCTSVDTLYLTIRHNTNAGTTVAACDSYVWHDSTYTVSGNHLYEYTAENNCPSVDTLHLTINVNNGFAETLTACDSIDWNGHVYYATGEYTVHYADANGCEADSVLTLTVNTATHNSETMVACDSYTWHGTPYTTSGVKTYSYDNGAGCASVDTLHLTIHHSDFNGENYATVTVNDWCGDYTWVINDSTIGTYTESVETSTTFTSSETGCDSVVFLKLTIKNAPMIDTTATVCENTLPYEWRGITMNAAGVKTVAFPLENGCDSTIRFTLNVNPKYDTLLTDQVCLGNGYVGNNFSIDAADLPAAGEYTFVDSLSTINGCDSIVTLTLTVGDVINNPVEAVACDSYTWTAGDNETYTYTTSGTYNSTAYANAQGCSTVDVLTLTINASTTGVDVQTACDTYTWIDGNTYTASNNTATFTLTNAAGCDSVVTLNLTLSSSTINTIEKTVCDKYEWTDGDGQTYTASGVYTYNYTTLEGCNGTDYLVLTVNNSSSSTETATACDSYTWNGETYTESGVYTFNTTNAAGCDSTATLTLTINASNTGVDVQTACDTYTWIDNNVYTASNNTATYTLTNAAGCDSVVTLNLTINNSVATSFTDEACNAYVWEGSYYAESGVYTKTFEAANGCDSVVTLTLTINQPVAETITETACGSYTWNGITYNASGNYTQTDVAANGCDSVTTLALTINQPVTSAISDTACESYIWNGETYTESGVYTYTTTAANGCDSVVTLTLTINTPANTTEEATACESYTWHGQVYTTNGAYTFNFTDNNGCAAVATLNLTINTPANTTETVTACNSYSWNNQTYTNSGVYTSTFVDDNGCNATATLSLTINNPVNVYVSETTCENYTWNGQTYYTSGVYTYTTPAANGCDSITTLTLTINQPTTATVYAEACGSYIWNGQTYTQPGAYPYTTTGSNGCDSTVTLLLNLVQPVQTIINQTACDSYTWNGTTYTTSGSYSDTLTAANNCDSVVTLNLTVNNSVTNAINATACESYTWNGQAYTTSGSYTQVFTAHNGCDSTVTLALTINTPTSAIVTETACSSFDWNGDTYTTSGSYTYTTVGANGCDSVTTLLLTINMPVYTNLDVNAEGQYSWNGETYTESGVYTYTTTAANGCDSVVTLTLTITPVYTVTLVSQNEAWGSVSESGTIAENGYFTATATANEGYEFVAWLNGNDTVSHESIYIFQVTADITLTAVFAEVQGINTVDMNNVIIYSNDTRIFVNGAEGYDVYVYDVNGRMIDRQLKAADAIEFRMTTTGVYLVKVGNAPAKRVIVVR